MWRREYHYERAQVWYEDSYLLQIDRRLTALIDLQLASQIPLVQEQR
jgi:hypothetical protein